MLLEFSKGKHIREESKLITEGWPAELTMLRVMRRLEVLPDDDLGLRRVISLYYRDGRVISSAEARRIRETRKIGRVEQHITCRGRC